MEAGEQKPQAGGGLFASCSFDDLGLHPTLCQHLRDKMGFQVPTKIQAQAIPVVISGRHSLVNAATGTGKTIVYLAPIVHLLQTYEPRIQRSDGTYALVLVPTRELCMQVYEILQKLLHCFHWIVPGYIMGGENRAKEKARLRKGISILIATPGRLLDHLKNTSSFQHTKLRWIVFDEADRILELGFGKAVEEILDILGSRQINHIPSNGKISNSVKCSRQNLLLSATLNEKVNHLANISLENPIMIGMDQNNSHIAHTLSVGNVTSAYVIDGDLKIHDGFASQTVENYNLPSQLVQKYVRVPSGSRLVILLSILRSLFEGKTSQKIVVFFSTCDAVDFHYALINEFKWSPSSLQEVKEQKFVSCTTFHLHGNMEHDNRRKAFQGFNVEKKALLLCTDVAARGLDIPKVRCIIQYDSPGEASEYVHRVGRTARLREKGEALLFLQPVEMDYLHDLQHHGVKLEEYQIQRCLDGFALHGKNFYKKSISLETHPWVLFLQKALETFISTEAKLNKLARNAFCSWVRAYTAHRGELKRIFLVKKLHLGHVARSFGLKDQPSWVGGSHKNEAKKRKKYGLKINSSKRRKTS
ncbi:DEAD-box ATP-dependent RNA helicase 17-like [Zingiber officinale]|uniref:DEAD-box ATP-dependent RNA helicase 17-like n=1 Tax=Zingiber officinale TaxID=94328 RepID=UPI001C4B0DFA|nr:DEAD-box ATP-dependent RNA helicase 17-like [Zingiber officinale]